MGINSVSFGLKVSLRKESLFLPFAPWAKVKSLLDIGHCAHFGRWSGKRNWLVPPFAPWAKVKSLLDIGHCAHFGQLSGKYCTVPV